MPRLMTSKLKQKATYWAAGATSTSTGKKKVAAAVEIDCRWEDGQSDALNGSGEAIRLDATVVVDRDVAVGSLFWLGEKADWSASVGGLYEAVTFSDTPDIRGKHFRKVVGLIRYNDKLPPIE